MHQQDVDFLLTKRDIESFEKQLYGANILLNLIVAELSI